MPDDKNIESLDLHWTDEDPDLGIASEGICCKDMAEIIGRISEVKGTVKKINLNNQHSLTEIPAVLGDCTLLEELDISFTGIPDIPAFLFSLPNLRSLSCCCWGLSSPITGFSKAEKLEKLHFRIKKDWDFPSEITALNSLKFLTIEIEFEIKLPENLGTLKKLEELSLSMYYENGDAPSLPASLENHPALKKININYNVRKIHKNFDLEKAAQILASCPKLETVQLSGLSVGKGCQNLSLLTKIKGLELRHILVEGNPFDAVKSLSNLEKLDIWGSEFKISQMPDIFGNLQKLKAFSFAGNMVLDIPSSIFALSGLTSLEIGSTGISSLDEKIGELKNLEKLHIYDNILETLPNSVFTLPRLALLNIEENNFKQNEIAAIKEKIASLAKNGQKIEFMADGQGHRLMQKKLRTLRNVSAMDTAIYYKYCLNAVNENPYALKYADMKKLQSRYFAELCIAAVRKNCLTLEIINPDVLEKTHYFYICIEAARSPKIGSAFKFLRDDSLTSFEYIQVCLEAALHNCYADFITQVNNKPSTALLSRSDYERICWAAVLHYPPAISKMTEPTKELLALAVKQGYGSKQ